MLGISALNGAGELRRVAIAARRIGVTPEQYAARKASGQSWCSYSKHWSPDSAFARTSMGRQQTRCNPCGARYNADRRQTRAEG